jgi:hypothetical protein
MCVISLCTRAALDAWSRGRSTAALCAVTSHIARPKIVLAAAALLAASLVLSLYAEVTFAFASVAAGAAPGFVVGRLLWPVLWVALQAWLLFKLLQGRNWARISFVIVVALGVVVRFLALSSPVAQLSGVTMMILAALQTVAELVAILFVLMAGSYFSPRASA